MKGPLKPKQILILTVTVLAVLGMIFITRLASESYAARSSKPANPAVVVLTASWCGTCREINPVVSRVVNSYPDLEMVLLDVDSSSAPSDAGKYGITIAGGSDLPQVYLYNEGRTILLFSGKGYKFGHSKQAEQQIRQQLENNL